MKRISPLARGLMFLPCLCLFAFISGMAQADTSSSWLVLNPPEFGVRNETVNDAAYPTTQGGKGNMDCSMLTFTKRTGILSQALNLYKESQVIGCYINTALGPINTNGLVNVSGSDYVAEMVKDSGQPVSHLVFPNTDMYLSNSSASPGVGVYVWFDHLTTSMKLLEMPDGKIWALVKPNNQVPLADKSGKLLPVMGDNFSISENGQWLVVDSPGRGTLRINLNTMEVLPFTNSFEFGNGVSAAIKTAISGDGRYAVVASKNYAYFKVFDLSTCTAVPDVITTPVSCQSRDLNTFIRSKISNMDGILQMRFLTNDLIKIYASYKVGSVSSIGEYIVATPGTSLAGMDYLALGDSFSSGEGAHKYEIGTDEKDVNMCHLSQVSFPYLIAQRLLLNSFHSVACSGATTINAVGGGIGIDPNNIKIHRDNQYKPDNKPSNNSLDDWIPGYRKQVEFVSENNPRLITVTVAGNDIGFAEKLTACVKPGTCFPTYEDKQEVFNEIDNKLKTFAGTYKKLKASATKNTKIYVIGYPQLALPTGNCALNVHLNQNELFFAASVITRLNTVIQTAAAQAGVYYVDTEDALNGYRLCENDSGNIAMNGLTAGKDNYGLIGNESYHPNEFGHELIANKILSITSNLGAQNPSEAPNTILTKIQDSDPSLADSPKTGRALRKRIALQVDNNTVRKGQKITAKLKGLAYALPPNTAYKVTLDDTQIGTVSTDSNGDVDLAIDVPALIQPGPVIVGLAGSDVTSQPVFISTTIMVGNDGSDFDGDEINDDEDACPTVVNSLIDVDQDNIDDACDELIGPAPTGPEPTSPAEEENTEPDHSPLDEIPADEPPADDSKEVETPPATPETLPAADEETGPEESTEPSAEESEENDISPAPPEETSGEEDSSQEPETVPAEVQPDPAASEEPAISPGESPTEEPKTDILADQTNQNTTQPPSTISPTDTPESSPPAVNTSADTPQSTPAEEDDSVEDSQPIESNNQTAVSKTGNKKVNEVVRASNVVSSNDNRGVLSIYFESKQPKIRATTAGPFIDAANFKSVKKATLVYPKLLMFIIITTLVYLIFLIHRRWHVKKAAEA